MNFDLKRFLKVFFYSFDMTKLYEKIIRTYRCRVCDKIHEVELSTKLLENKQKFPFPYVFLHGELKDFLTILYLDEELQIRASEVQNLSQDYDNVFSKDHTFEIVANLMEEIESLRDQTKELFPKDQLKVIISNLMEEIEKLRAENTFLLKKLEKLQ